MSVCFFFSSRRRHTRWTGDWSSDVCSSDLRFWVRSHERQRSQPRLDCGIVGGLDVNHVVADRDDEAAPTVTPARILNHAKPLTATVPVDALQERLDAPLGSRGVSKTGYSDNGSIGIGARRLPLRAGLCPSQHVRGWTEQGIQQGAAYGQNNREHHASEEHNDSHDRRIHIAAPWRAPLLRE